MMINMVTIQGPFLQRARVGDRTLEKVSKDGECCYCTEIIPQCSDKFFQEWPDERIVHLGQGLRFPNVWGFFQYHFIVKHFTLSKVK